MHCCFLGRGDQNGFSGCGVHVLVLDEDVLRLVCGYGPQSGTSLEDRLRIISLLKSEIRKQF